jgi:hypothetical protein
MFDKTLNRLPQPSKEQMKAVRERIIEKSLSQSGVIYVFLPCDCSGVSEGI